MVFRPPLYQKMYPIYSAIVEKMPVKSIKMFCFRLQVPCYNVATKYVPLLRCTTLGCFHPFLPQFETQRTTFVPLPSKKGSSPLGDNPRLIRFFSAEVPLEQPLEGLAVAGFVASHLMHGVMNRVEVMCICSACGCPYTLTFCCQLRDIIRDIILIRHARHPPNDIIAT